MAENPYQNAQFGDATVLPGFDNVNQPAPPAQSRIPVAVQEGPVGAFRPDMVSDADINASLNGFNTPRGHGGGPPKPAVEQNWQDVKFEITPQDDPSATFELWGPHDRNKIIAKIAQKTDGAPGVYRVTKRVGRRGQRGQYDVADTYFIELDDEILSRLERSGMFGNGGPMDDMFQMPMLQQPSNGGNGGIDPSMFQLILGMQNANAQSIREMQQQTLQLVLAGKEKEPVKSGVDWEKLLTLISPAIPALIEKFSGGSDKMIQVMEMGMKLAQTAQKPSWLDTLGTVGALGAAPLLTRLMDSGAAANPTIADVPPPTEIIRATPVAHPTPQPPPRAAAPLHPFDEMWLKVMEGIESGAEKKVHPQSWAFYIHTFWDDDLTTRFLNYPTEKLVEGFNRVTANRQVPDQWRTAIGEWIDAVKHLLKSATHSAPEAGETSDDTDDDTSEEE